VTCTNVVTDSTLSYLGKSLCSHTDNILSQNVYYVRPVPVPSNTPLQKSLLYSSRLTLAVRLSCRTIPLTDSFSAKYFVQNCFFSLRSSGVRVIVLTASRLDLMNLFFLSLRGLRTQHITKIRTTCNFFRTTGNRTVTTCQTSFYTCFTEDQAVQKGSIPLMYYYDNLNEKPLKKI